MSLQEIVLPKPEASINANKRGEKIQQPKTSAMNAILMAGA